MLSVIISYDQATAKIWGEVDAFGGLGGCSGSVLAYSGIDSKCEPSLQAHQSSVHPQNPTSVLLS